ncbi:isoprenylcysteine carboxylmethyltransferase family protein [Paludibacterium sp.]|uniref:methyltransferase family protein n=1 Tax=Paludibacterium sp. TaxID=1917523 RepID=UPI0025E30E06|nr:isoprenylcysteine carboxylmethyltransferase family protein [Paludibacterium sp.]MBV8647751.1 isoprenylcysteine carboxylmethyltransferase family protein [Paludibacterium sp.]
MTSSVMKIFWRDVISLAVIGLGLLLAAGTAAYWQAWLLLAVLFFSGLPYVWLIGQDPLLRESRLKGGPRAESRPIQKVIAALLFAAVFAGYLVPALDRRFGWSAVPVWLCLVGEALVLACMGLTYRVFQVNAFGSATVQVVDGQRVIDTGPYAVVRHPMYAGAAIYTVGLPLALGSWWGLLPAAVAILAFAWRLADEEALLAAQLPGYAAYRARVRWRLFPGVY